MNTTAQPLWPHGYFADDYHRRDFDALTEKYSDARMWQREHAQIARHRPSHEVPEFLRREPRGSTA